jgi:hypothetical protein
MHDRATLYNSINIRSAGNISGIRVYVQAFQDCTRLDFRSGCFMFLPFMKVAIKIILLCLIEHEKYVRLCVAPPMRKFQ